MTAGRVKVDGLFLFLASVLTIIGFFIFSSASLALLAKENSNYSDVFFSQTVFGLLLGVMAMITTMRLELRFWRRLAFWILLAAIVLNILVLIPGIGRSHGGAVRWLSIGPLSLQVSEVLKFAFVIYFAAWAAKVKERMKSLRYGVLPMVTLFSIVGILMLSQPDTDNFMVVVFAGLAMFLVAGGRWRYIIILIVAVIIVTTILALTRPYLKQRIISFLNPNTDIHGANYQIRQSWIAVGSGGLFGRGFGQSVQKFNFLPEPVGDSIFAVAAEEFGFIGSVILIALFVLFATRGLKIASETPDAFARLVVVGIVIMIVTQAFVNIGAMLGLVPLSGITLPFISQGGTSLFMTLLEVGIILSASRTARGRNH